jgi:soluble lytic murein transglycosylase-like protein
MAESTITRRAILRSAGGLVLATAGGLALPGRVEAAHYCGYQFGPIHQWLYANGVDPAWQHDIVWRESNFQPGATNPYSGAAGLAQFLFSTWRWGEERFGLYGSPYDWVLNLTMMNAFLSVGEYGHWDCHGEC